MLKFGFIGLGQVGGMFAESAKKYGYTTLAINTANVDLNNLEKLEKSEKVHLFGYEGAGKDRSVGQEAFHTHEDAILERIHERMNDCHVIFPVFALGGGTGSGMSGLIIEKLTEIYQDKVISPILFMPDSEESPRALMNALEAFADISENKEIGAVLVIDNKKIYEVKQKETLKQKFQSAREEVIALLDLFNKRTVKKSELSNFDEMDLLTVLSERGAAVISQMGIGADHVENIETMGNAMIHSWKNSVFANCDYKSIARSALIVDIPAKLTPSLKLDTAFHAIGRPLEVFSGIFEENDGKMYSLITGLPFPKDILKEISESVEKNEKRLVELIDKTRNQEAPAKSCWTVTLKRKRKIKI